MSASDLPEFEVLLLAGAVEARGRSAYTLRLARKLEQYGIAATLVTSNGRLLDASQRAGLRLREYGRLESRLCGGYVARCLRRDLDDRPPQVVHVESPRMLRLGQWLAKKWGCPCILTLHAPLEPCATLRIDPRVCRRIIAASEAIHDDLVNGRGFPEELVTTIVNGVDIDPVLARPAPLDPGHVPVVGTAGPLEAIQGVPYLEGAACRVLAVAPEVEFLVAGAGPDEANLRRIARELGIVQKVTFMPYGLDFAKALAAMDIFCLPTLRQGASTIMLEAMALGLPVIATGSGGDSVVRDGQTGLLAPPENSEKLAGLILELLRNPSLARKLGAAARELVLREFDADRMVLQTAELYREVCACLLKSSPLAAS